MMQNTRARLARRPEGLPGPETWTIDTEEVAEPKDGEFLAEVRYISLDPAMRGWMSEDRGSYIPPVELGEIMRSSGVAEVVESRSDSFAVGDRVVGMIGWTEYAVSTGQGLNKLPQGVSAEAVLCVLSLPGLTAWQGLMEIGKPKAGETLVVAAATGPVEAAKEMASPMIPAEAIHAVTLICQARKMKYRARATATTITCRKSACSPQSLSRKNPGMP